MANSDGKKLLMMEQKQKKSRDGMEERLSKTHVFFNALKLHMDNEERLNVLENLTTNADQIQNQVLLQIISQNSNTEYLSRFHLHHDTDTNNLKQVFKKIVPIVEHEDINAYIQRIAFGEPSSIICAWPITEFYTSSGTSGGQPKLIPSTVEGSEKRSFVINLFDAVINKHVEGLDQGKTMSIVIIKPVIMTPSGLVVGPVSTASYKSDHIQNHAFCTSPLETIFCSNVKQSMYCQLLCGLVQREEVVRIADTFASSFLRVIKFIEDYWKEMCSNIRTGQVSDWITEISCRNAVSQVLGKPSPELARLIEMEFDGGRSSWEGIVKRLWPRTKYIGVVVTGSMSQYVPTLEFYCDNIPLVSNMYGSSECYFGVNLNPFSKPSDVSYTLLPNVAYFELICVDKDQGKEHSLMQHANGCFSCEKVVDLVDVQVGYYYEIVITTFTGLYRYRVGDILMVTGFHNNAPQFKFVERISVALSIDVEKTSENDLLKAINQAKLPIEQRGFRLTDYTSYADTSSIPGHYVLFWELVKNNGGDGGKVEVDPTVMEECCNKVEEMLDAVYRKYRKKEKSIGALEIRVVKQGTFDELMDFYVAKGGSANQYKTPRCIKSAEVIGILNSRVLGKYFSNTVPLWEPFQILVPTAD